MAPDSDPTGAAGAAPRGDLMERVVDLAIRLGRAWRALSWQQRRAAVAAIVLFITLFLPWYQDSVVRSGALRHGAAPISQSLSGWAAFSVVQAGVLILSLGLLFLLFLKGEGRAGRLPGGDGGAITVAGALSLLLVIIGLFDAPTPTTRSQYVVSTGLEWGIFAALIAAAALLYTGSQIRRSGQRRPVDAEDDRVVFDGRWREPGRSEGPHRAPDPVPAPAPQETRAPEPATERTTPPPAGSHWRPGESPGWSEPERPVGWLTAPPRHLQEGDDGSSRSGAPPNG